MRLRDSDFGIRISFHLALVSLLALVVVLPRSILITRAHSESVDDEYHLDHGMSVLTREHQPLTYNDPPLGEVILALPLYVAGVRVHVQDVLDSNGELIAHRSLFYGQRLSPETLRMMVAVWKSLLFVPGIIVVFIWCRRIYGVQSAWLASVLFLIEPTIAGHIPVAALDVLAMQGVIIAAFFVWRYLEQPDTSRLIAAGVATSVAMLIKHTAIVLPAAIVVLALLHWFVRPWWRGASFRQLRNDVRPRLNALAAGAMIVLLAMWPLTLFDFSRPSDAGRMFSISYEDDSLVDDLLVPALSSRWPAGIYIGSVLEAVQHAREGHSAFLWGEVRDHGWWYYFPAVALYKVPIGIWIILILAIISLIWARPKWEEMGLLVPAVACGVLIMSSGINLGFRHALSAYGLLLMLASRCIATPMRLPKFIAWSGAALAAIHAVSYHPDYIAYVNAPWKRPWLAIADSNLDWGQSLKQINRWLDQNPPPPDKPIYFDGFAEPLEPGLSYYVRHKIRVVPKNGPAPTEGLLIVSPSFIAGIYHSAGHYPHLRGVDPIDIIGHSMLVYDLDELRRQNTPDEVNQ